MTSIILDDITLFHDVSGDGEPVVLLHAGICDHRMWDPQWPTLTEKYRAVRLDLPGCGQSTLPPHAFAYHDIVLRLMDHLAIDRAVLIGASFGGSVALDVALAAPDRVRGLILAAPAVGGAITGWEVDAFGDQEDALIDSGDLDAAAQLNVDFWLVGQHRAAKDVNPALRQAVFTMQRGSFDVPVPEGCRSIKLDPPATTRLREIMAPTLVIGGLLDTPSFVDLARRAAHEIPNAQLWERPNTAHLPTYEDPDPATVRILEALSQFTGTPGPYYSD
ncbi:MAG: alpha/beta hydrolase [Chloroflexi bacterium]|nr:alpha/beta hydrolase [Chloroflexota bacterium]